MSFVCPQCHSEVDEEVLPCPPNEEPASPDAPDGTTPVGDSRFPFWNILPWCLLGAVTLILLPHLRPQPAPITTPPPAVAAAPNVAPALPVTLPLPPAEAIGTARVPLTVTLYSVGSGKHVSVGVPVVISAYAALAPSQSATITIFYSKDNEPKSLLSLAQGSFSSTAWTPTAPGHYKFTASALDRRKASAFSQRVSFWVDAPTLTQAPPSRPVVPKAVSLPAVRHLPLASHQVAVSRPALPYHVAAATFPVQPIAATLAGALRRRGFHAFVRPHVPGQARQSYAVETGDFVRKADAQKQMRLLQHDGYPAYLFRLR